MINSAIRSEGVNLSTARPDLATALLAVRLCTGPLLVATSGRSRRKLHTLSAAAIVALVFAGASSAQGQIDQGSPLGREIRIGRDSAAGRVVAVEHEGRASYVRIETREPGAEPNQHPVAIDGAAMRALLATLRLPGRKPEQLLTAAMLDEISAPLSSAMRKATPEQDVTFAVSDRHGLLGPLSARAVTTARVFRRDGQLQVIAGLVRRDFESQFRATGYLIPFEPGSRARAVDASTQIAVETGAGTIRRADWVALSLEAAKAAQVSPTPAAAPAAAAAPSTGSPAPAAVAPAAAAAGVAPAPAAPAAQPDADAIFRNVSERLKALQRLRDSGAISESEYQEKRRQILKDM